MAVVTRKVAVLPCTTETLAAAAVIVSVGGASTVRVVVADWVAAPLVPVMAILMLFRAGAAVVTETVAVLLVPGFTLAGLKLTMTPLGAVAFRVTDCVYPLVAATATVKVAVLPCTMLIGDDSVFSVKVGAATVMALLVVPVKAPLAPVIAILAVPVAAEVEAETVAVALAPGVTVVGLKVTVMPLGALMSLFKATGLVKLW